jgi:hypothetical protein
MGRVSDRIEDVASVGYPDNGDGNGEIRKELLRRWLVGHASLPY